MHKVIALSIVTFTREFIFVEITVETSKAFERNSDRMTLDLYYKI